jgi:putative mRNA 3-end processing factor
MIGSVEISFIPAGHILGSAQILMQHQGIRYLYTGDIKSQTDPTCEALEITQADVLITETTFANPTVIHPDPIAEIKKLSSVKHNIMLGCYSLGKAQRITYLINQHCPEKTVYVHHNILPLHRLYDQIGLAPLKYEIYHRKVMNEGRDKIYLVPPMTFNSYIRAKNVLRVFASGWQRLQRHNDMELYISDHMDWNDILQLISTVSPTEIWTVHGDGRNLAQYLKGQMNVRELT